MDAAELPGLIKHDASLRTGSGYVQIDSITNRKQENQPFWLN